MDRQGLGEVAARLVFREALFASASAAGEIFWTTFCNVRATTVRRPHRLNNEEATGGSSFFDVRKSVSRRRAGRYELVPFPDGDLFSEEHLDCVSALHRGEAVSVVDGAVAGTVANPLSVAIRLARIPDRMSQRRAGPRKRGTDGDQCS